MILLMRSIAIIVLTLIAAPVMSAPAAAVTLVAKVDIKGQRMTVFVNGVERHRWVVSTGRQGWETQPGRYTPFNMVRDFYSDKWRMRLPYLVWIGQDGTAIHGTEAASKLGRPASHGCIRLAIPNAQRFYKLVEEHGMWNTEVVVIN